MEPIRFATNTAQEVALQFDDGKPVEGRFGPRVLFTLTDGRLMYLPPFAAQKIQDLKIAKSEVFSIGKFEVKTGQKRSVQWIVKRVDPAADPSASLNGLSGSIQATTSGIKPTATPPAEQPVPPKLVPINGNAAGQAAEQATAIKLVEATQIGDALKTVIAGVAMATQFAKGLDYAVHFTSEDIRAMAITLVIGVQQHRNGNGSR